MDFLLPKSQLKLHCCDVLLYISTSIWVLCTKNAGRNLLLKVFNGKRLQKKKNTRAKHSWQVNLKITIYWMWAGVMQGCQIQISKTRSSSQEKPGVDQEIFIEKSREKSEDIYRNQEVIWLSFFEDSWTFRSRKCLNFLLLSYWWAHFCRNVA